MIELLFLFDQKIFLILNSWNANWLNPIMIFLSGKIVWIPFIILGLLFSFRKMEKRNFYVFLLFISLAIIASDVTSSYIIKNLVQRLRPCRLSELKPFIHHFGQKCGGKYGFISSHAANAFCLITYFLTVFKKKSLRYSLLWLLPFLVSYSRIYLGVHYPLDLIGGSVVGISWGMTMGGLVRSFVLRSKPT